MDHQHRFRLVRGGLGVGEEDFLGAVPVLRVVGRVGRRLQRIRKGVDFPLRTYARVARTDHWCDKCALMIEPGMLYQGTILALGDGKLIVMKEHMEPPCPRKPIWEDLDEDFDEDEQPETDERSAVA